MRKAGSAIAILAIALGVIKIITALVSHFQFKMESEGIFDLPSTEETIRTEVMDYYRETFPAIEFEIERITHDARGWRVALEAKTTEPLKFEYDYDEQCDFFLLTLLGREFPLSDGNFLGPLINASASAGAKNQADKPLSLGITRFDKDLSVDGFVRQSTEVFDLLVKEKVIPGKISFVWYQIDAGGHEKSTFTLDLDRSYHDRSLDELRKKVVVSPWD